MKDQRLDIITTLTQSIIETILCLLPIEEAARTSILSREWRFKWTTIPKLVFTQSTVKSSSKESHLSNQENISDLERERRDKEMRCKLFYVILQVLLQRQGPIHEFTLLMDACDTSFELDQILLHLSRNHTISKLTLDLNESSLPMSLFSLHQLTDLSLRYCGTNNEAVFNGFGSLTSLSLDCIWMSIENLLADDDLLWGQRKPTIMEFFKCLPVIEHLTTTRYLSQYGVEVSVPEEFTTSLIHLKYYCFKEMSVDEPDGWTFLMVLLKCSPNLEKIKLEMDAEVEDCDLKSVMFEEYSDVWLQHLNELEVKDFTNLKVT